MKTGLTPEDALVCYAARKLGRPVKWRAERSEEFLAAHMARDQHYTRGAGARPRRAHPRAAHGDAGQHRRGAGRLLRDDPARHGRQGGDLGVPRAGGRLPHQGRAHQHHGDRRLSRRRPARRQLPDRAADREGGARDGHRPRRAAPAQPAHARRAAVQDARRRDLRQRRVRAHAATGALRAADWDGFAQAKKRIAQRGKLRGRGLAVYLEWTGALPTETVDIEIDADGTVTVFSGTQAMGQGLETTLYAAGDGGFWHCLGDKIKIVQGDTDRANGVGSVGSRSAFVGGSAVVAAGRKMIAAAARSSPPRRSRPRPADIELRDGRLRIAGTDRSIGAGRAGRRASRRSVIRVSATADAVDAVVAERRAGVRGGDRPRHRRGDARRAHELRRHRPHHQPRHRRGADPRRHGAGRRPGAVGAGALRRRQRPAASPAR